MFSKYDQPRPIRKKLSRAQKRRAKKYQQSILNKKVTMEDLKDLIIIN